MRLPQAHGPLAVLHALGDEPVSTSDLYERIGYVELMRVNLIPYAAFRRALAELDAEGLAESSEAEDGATLWRRAGPAVGPGGPRNGA